MSSNPNLMMMRQCISKIQQQRCLINRIYIRKFTSESTQGTKTRDHIRKDAKVNVIWGALCLLMGGQFVKASGESRKYKEETEKLKRELDSRVTKESVVETLLDDSFVTSVVTGMKLRASAKEQVRSTLRDSLQIHFNPVNSTNEEMNIQISGAPVVSSSSNSVSMV